MDIKEITIQEAREMMKLLEAVPVQSRGTIDEQCVMYANLSSFAAKLAVAIKEEKSMKDETELAPTT